MPKDGVYKTKTKINDKFYPSVTFIGIRQSTDGKYSCESHVINEDVKSVKSTTICFLDFIRENKKFENLSELKLQISKDIKKALL